MTYTKCTPGTYNDIEGLLTPYTKTCDIGRIPTVIPSSCTFCPVRREVIIIIQQGEDHL